ncbi:MAG: hypothetical protein RLZZ502_552 [Pseudomonadota bacterium]|jgi:hypothetical protein
MGRMKNRQVPILPNVSPTVTIVVETPKPRNPVAVAARQRKAGTHEQSTGGKRQMQQRELARQLWSGEDN